MKRPMCILAVSWLAGLLLASREISVPIMVVIFVYFFLIILGLLVLKKHPQILNPHIQIEWYPQLTILLLMIPSLFLGGYWRMQHFLVQQSEREQPWILLSEEGENYVTLEGTVREKQCEERITLEVTDCVIIGYYGQENQVAGDCRVTVDGEGKEWLPETLIGNKIRVFGRFSLFSPASNPGQFDAHEYYTKQGLFADVTALRITVLEDSTQIGHGMFVLKQRMRDSITSLYPPEKAGVLVAMILGDKDLLSEEVEELYRENGISHILAISGLHISMLCMGLYGFLRKLTVPVKVSVAVAVGFLVFYVLFTGASTSSLRAGIMCLVMFGAILLRRSYDLLSSLALAAILVTVLRPGELTSAGFLLSFGAMLGVAVAKEAEEGIAQALDGKRPWWNALVFGVLVQCTTIPISLWFFYELSPYSILLNLAVIPLVSLILGGGVLSSALGTFWPTAARLPVGGTYLLLGFYERLCEVTQKLPFSFVLLGQPELWQMVVYYAVLAIVLKLFFMRITRLVEQKERSLKNGPKGEISVVDAFMIFTAGIVCVIFILLLLGNWNAELLFLDVSQGDGALITTEEGTVILSDCGSSDVSNVGEYRLAPVLKQRGILLVDMAVVSHLDSDHTSGIKELLESMQVFEGQIRYMAEYAGAVGIKELVLPKVLEKSEAYLELEALALEKNVKVRYLQAGEQLYREEKLLIECIYPKNAGVSENDTSLVFLMQTPKLIAWMMGDAGTMPEQEIMSHLAAVNMDALRENKLVLLKVGHHGSKTSSGQEFINFVQPDIAVISCGYRNSYGHPHASVVERLEDAESEVFRTDLQGAVVVELGRSGEPEVIAWRKKARK